MMITRGKLPATSAPPHIECCKLLKCFGFSRHWEADQLPGTPEVKTSIAQLIAEKNLITGVSRRRNQHSNNILRRITMQNQTPYFNNNALILINIEMAPRL